MMIQNDDPQSLLPAVSLAPLLFLTLFWELEICFDKDTIFQAGRKTVNHSIHINVTTVITSKLVKGKDLCNACFLFVIIYSFCLCEEIKGLGWMLSPLPGFMAQVPTIQEDVCFSVAMWLLLEGILCNPQMQSQRLIQNFHRSKLLILLQSAKQIPILY